MMDRKYDFNCQPTAIGSMPHVSAKEALSLILKYLPDIPHWPQLPRYSTLENMYIQFSEGFPGIVVKDSKVQVMQSDDFDTTLEQLYNFFEEENLDMFKMSAEYGAGLYSLISHGAPQARMIKGQITGPVSWGLTVTDREGRGILYDELLTDNLARFLRFKVSWQERILRTISNNTIIFIDEPFLVSLGSAFVPVSSELVTASLKEVLKGIQGLKGIHCCGNTDWALLLNTDIDILSFDAYNYSESLGLYTKEVKTFFERGGIIAWGIIPNDEEILAKESIYSLKELLKKAVAPFVEIGIPYKQVVKQSLITPSCGLASMSVEGSARALKLLAELSLEIREEFSILS